MSSIQVERDAGVVTITLSNPGKKNAIGGAMWADLEAACREIRGRRDDRAVVITGADGEFCSGADLWQAPGEEPKHPMASMRDVSYSMLAVHSLPQPTIAKVPGVAAGAGCSLALACDLIVAGSSARFSEIFAKRGLALDAGSSWLLPRIVGLHRAKELAFFAEILSADEAADIGIVNRVVPDDELDAFVDDWARRLAAGPPIALALSKKLLNNASHATFEQALEDEGRSQAINLQSQDTVEAISAFAQKRTPTFHGR